MLGNGEKGSGDAYKYRGRGPMQITGKDNYQAFEDWYQNEGSGSVDFTEKPGKLSSNARIGTLAALHYWDENVLGSDKVDEDNLTVADITEAINGGDTGLEIRKDHFEPTFDTRLRRPRSIKSLVSLPQNSKNGIVSFFHV